MAQLERIFIRIDPETGRTLRSWFASQGTTLAGAIQDFLMAEYEKSQAVAPSEEAAIDVEASEAEGTAEPEGTEIEGAAEPGDAIEGEPSA